MISNVIIRLHGRRPWKVKVNALISNRLISKDSYNMNSSVFELVDSQLGVRFALEILWIYYGIRITGQYTFVSLFFFDNLETKLFLGSLLSTETTLIISINRIIIMPDLIENLACFCNWILENYFGFELFDKSNIHESEKKKKWGKNRTEIL